MWLLIEVDNEKDAGKNEKRRILIGNIQITDLLLQKTIEAIGIEVHPNTPENKEKKP